MRFEKFITHLDISPLQSLKEDLILLYYENLDNFKYFESKEGIDYSISKLDINDEFINEFVEYIIGKDIEYKVVLYQQNKNHEHEIHKDVGGIKSSLNMILIDNDSPIIFYDDDKYELRYDCALLNVSIPHSVPKSERKRVYLRIAIKEDYNVIRQKIKSYCKSSK